MTPDLRVALEVLSEPDDAELAWKVIAPSYDAVDIYSGPTAFLESLQPLTRGQRALLAINWCVAEVQNGGFLQFFDNPTAVVAAEAVTGLRLIGVPEAAELILAATALLNSEPSRAGASDRAMSANNDANSLDALRERLAPLEERFDQLVDESVYSNAAAFVRLHREDFVRS
jgi:hypothetical protein